MEQPKILSHKIDDDFIGSFETNHPSLPLDECFDYFQNNGLVFERQRESEEVHDNQVFLNRVSPRFFNDRLIAPMYQTYSALCDLALNIYFYLDHPKKQKLKIHHQQFFLLKLIFY